MGHTDFFLRFTFLFYADGYYTCMYYVCIPHACLMPWILRTWRSRQLWAAMRVLGTEPGSSTEGPSAPNPLIISPAPRTQILRHASFQYFFLFSTNTYYFMFSVLHDRSREWLKLSLWYSDHRLLAIHLHSPGNRPWT